MALAWVRCLPVTVTPYDYIHLYDCVPPIFSSGQFTGHIYQPGAWIYSRAAGNATVF